MGKNFTGGKFLDGNFPGGNFPYSKTKSFSLVKNTCFFLLVAIFLKCKIVLVVGHQYSFKSCVSVLLFFLWLNDFLWFPLWMCLCIFFHGFKDYIVSKIRFFLVYFVDNLALVRKEKIRFVCTAAVFSLCFLFRNYFCIIMYIDNWEMVTVIVIAIV